MSLLSNLTELAGSTGRYTDLAEAAKHLMQQGVRPTSPQARKIIDMVKQLIPDHPDAADLVQKIDALLPDAIQSQFGFTPEVMRFIVEALGGSPARGNTPH